MRIAIVDDNPEDRRQAVEMTEKCCKARNLHTQIVQYSDGTLFLEDCKENPPDVVLMDIYLGGLDGVEVARRLRESDKMAKLIFTTVTGAFAREGYDVQATHYLMKPLREDKLQTALDRCFSDIAQDSRSVELKVGYQEYTVLLRNILFVRKDGNYIYVHTSGEVELKVHQSLVQFMQTVGQDPRFLQCYQGYAVNLQHVVGLGEDNNSFALDNGMTVPLAKKNRSALHAAWISYEARLLQE
ncbi:LytTR family DNA-binding domain-containing protein [Ruminococcaceae bacterium OttesenSCG-928-I18]|nr:LytTR family DNA-binding domain-containing protein [Ruminococcaceae bacterium OttesenSCG-928-I18]